MKSRYLFSEINKPISQIGLGTVAYNVENKEKWYEILDYFVENGGTLIDTARGYSTSEEVIGSWLNERPIREKVVILTKCGLTSQGILPEENYPDIVHNELSTSLQTLRTDYVDIYMLHRDNLEMTVEQILAPLNEEIAKGRVKVLGASNWEYRRVEEANQYAYKHNMKGFALVSNTLSLAVPSAAFYPGLVSTDKMGERWHIETGIPLVPWSSLARGFFTGKYTPDMRNDASLKPGSFEARMVKVYCTDENFERLNRAKELGERKGYTAMEVALAWLLYKPFPIVPLVGPRECEELASCIKALSLSLTETEVKWLNLEA